MENLRILMAFLLLLASGCNLAEKKQNEAQKQQENEAPKVVTADIEAGIKAHIAREVEAGDGYFYMETDDGALRLELVRVHTEYLSNLGPGRHFACVDLADVSGDVYDVDFFLSGDPGNMVVDQTTLHKLNGKPFYTWKQQEDKTWTRVPVETASNELLGVVEGQDAFTFQYEATLPEMDQAAEIWIPVARSDRFQTVQLRSLEAPAEYRMLEEPEFGNQVLYMELSPEHSGAKIALTYDVRRLEKMPYREDVAPGDYLGASLLMPTGDRFQILADSIIGARQATGTLMQARALYDYVIDNMRYAKWEKYGTGDAVYACDALTGNCTEFHSLFISLARSAGIPSRFAVGASIPSERDEGGIDGYHCWAEFYAEGKWWPIDISEANKYTALSTYYFGRHPANRIEFTRGRDLILEPGPKTGPINFLAYPVMEVGGSPVLVDTFFSFTRTGQAKSQS
jgi:transglutaminase-like putative cysteine protease